LNNYFETLREKELYDEAKLIKDDLKFRVSTDGYNIMERNSLNLYSITGECVERTLIGNDTEIATKEYIIYDEFFEPKILNKREYNKWLEEGNKFKQEFLNNKIWRKILWMILKNL